jgi:transcriptional regulator with XRE-family HTH domain
MLSRIKELREAKGIRREDIASLAFVSYETIRRLEMDDGARPTLAVARRIADVLGVTVDEVFPPAGAPPEVA